LFDVLIYPCIAQKEKRKKTRKETKLGKERKENIK
jgi:hypothetical protein